MEVAIKPPGDYLTAQNLGKMEWEPIKITVFDQIYHDVSSEGQAGEEVYKFSKNFLASTEIPFGAIYRMESQRFDKHISLHSPPVILGYEGSGEKPTLGLFITARCAPESLCSSLCVEKGNRF